MYKNLSSMASVSFVSGEGAYIHRFYDTSPISPSGKYIALFRFPYEAGDPKHTDCGVVTVFHIKTSTIVFEYKTDAWDSQLGAQVQWGADDSELYFNILDSDDMPIGVRVDIVSGDLVRLPQSVYMVSPCGRFSATPCLKRIVRVQKGYGVRISIDLVPENFGAPEDDGVYIQNFEDGQSFLLCSFREIYDTLKEKFHEVDLSKGGFYGFHTKWSPDSSELMFLVRWKQTGVKHTKNFLIVMARTGKSIRMVVDSKRWVGGHHPNWCPDGRNIVMNLTYRKKSDLYKYGVYLEKISRKLKFFRYFSDYKPLRLSIVSADGAGDHQFNTIAYGSGHPIMLPGNNIVITDSYPNERVASGDGFVPIRAITENKVVNLLELYTIPHGNKTEEQWRIDPHPALSRCGKYLSMNFLNGGRRGVLVVDIGRKLGEVLNDVVS